VGRNAPRSRDCHIYGKDKEDEEHVKVMRRGALVEETRMNRLAKGRHRVIVFSDRRDVWGSARGCLDFIDALD
jgi:hypothetical protein